MTKYFSLIMLACGVALAVLIGQHMSTDALAVVLGVIVGIAASVPFSLLLVALLSRRSASYAPATLARRHVTADGRAPEE